MAQDKPKLIHNMQKSVELAKAYKEHYKMAKEQLASQPKSKQFDFDEQVRVLRACCGGRLALTPRREQHAPPSTLLDARRPSSSSSTCSPSG